MTVLLDTNVLIALLTADHVHHDSAEAWFAANDEGFATCPITQGGLIRLVLRHGATAVTATGLLSSLTAHPRHEFWPDDIPFEAVPMRGVIGHRQVTDAYLAYQARSRRGRLATFDQGLAKLHHDIADLLPTDPRR
ncbi:PIN domain-containing protein [Asanoa sp. WMMD1127]|uniref:TA system VapC family ribonuclease toxin n=1 Tax=Asanoa sp. WMMD1127 TaxID=3016107 RepID=UPI00241766B8|nr:TA system VapC family ribonuclease toxin [Asanoa sp. WMMD1127]MDG4826797.1 PIN domain-containing protein [Asanoa sp. WMMD1127]